MLKITDILDEAIKSTLTHVAYSEKEKQQQTAKSIGKTEEKKSIGSSKTVLDEKEKVSTGAVKFDDIIDRLNATRSGHSFMKEPTSTRIDQYVSSLSKTERVVLFAFLSGIKRIVTGEAPLMYKDVLAGLVKSVKEKDVDVRTSHIVEVLNAIRSGRSFKDEDIVKLLKAYSDALDQDQKVLLMAFLNGISNIATQEIAAVQTEAADEKSKLVSGDISSDDIIDKLNTIRSGKSFKDDKIASSMKQYVDSLEKAEKTALLAFLKGIAQIITGEVGGDEALEPEDKPANVKMQKGGQHQTKHLVPNVIKVSKPEEKTGKKPVEDTTPPAPITPKKK